MQLLTNKVACPNPACQQAASSLYRGVFASAESTRTPRARQHYGRDRGGPPQKFAAGLRTMGRSARDRGVHTKFTPLSGDSGAETSSGTYGKGPAPHYEN